MSNESIYDLAVLAATLVLAIVSLCLVAFSDLPLELGTAGLGVAAGAFGVRSGRALVGRSD